MNHHSVLVCGTGIAGLACALGLAKASFDVALLGPQTAPPADRGDTYHPRVYALSPSSQRFLTKLGVWPLLDEARVTPVEAMEVYGDADGAVHLHAWQTAQPALAWIVESGELERVLLQSAQVFGIPWYTEKLHRLASQAVVTDTGRQLPFDLLVGADGAGSAVRTAAGIAEHSKPYGDSGLVVHLDAEQPHQNAALQWFTGDSVLALLPLPNTRDGHQVSMVWSMPSSQAEALQGMPESQRNQALEVRLQAVTGGRLGRLRVRSTLFGFPLTLAHSTMTAPHIALVGDAAHRVHPLAGQGLNLGLGDVRDLLDVLATREAWRSVGDERVLARYRRARAEPVLAMRAATDGLYRLFAVQAAPVAWIRNLGMQWANRVPLIKRLLIAGAD